MVEHNVSLSVDGVGMRMAFRWHFWAAVEQLARYIITGGDVTLVRYMVLFGLVQMEVSPWRASAVGSVIGTTLNYPTSRQAVLDSTRGHIGAMVHFGLVAFLALECNTTIMVVGLGVGLYYLIAQMFVSSVMTIFGFLVHRHWTFRNADAVAAPTEPQPIIVPTRPTHDGP